MSFAEKILDSMVDENGHCGERGLSEKQFNILSERLKGKEPERAGNWNGDHGGHIQFWSTDYEGTIGKYRVKLNCFSHFHDRYTVVSVDRWIDEVPSFKDSQFQAEPKKRLDLELTLIRECGWEQKNNFAYGYEWVNLFVLSDEDGNCYVWKTTNDIEEEIDDEFMTALPGDKVHVRGTVKEHNKYRGVNQTVLTRCKCSNIRKYKRAS